MIELGEEVGRLHLLDIDVQSQVLAPHVLNGDDDVAGRRTGAGNGDANVLEEWRAGVGGALQRFQRQLRIKGEPAEVRIEGGEAWGNHAVGDRRDGLQDDLRDRLLVDRHGQSPAHIAVIEGGLLGVEADVEDGKLGTADELSVEI